ncbi:Ku protein [Polaromonas sp.]|uniref:non-homologous end joining protein Ku n=1 Tax=Polaromonas sp. TaxID=1869339 RepID=UPI0025E22A42|nr:Ku protein [Polaromonas sp.]
MRLSPLYRKHNMAEASSRVLWKGAITFGLVHIPVGLHSATSEQGIDFDWLDKRSMDPVGYKRINKKTGKEIAKENIVKGIAYEQGEYVILSEKEIADAYPKTTQTIEIEAFVDAGEIPFVYLERPYYIAPINKGAKVYALLRETLLKTGKVGVARVVIQTKQHLAALIPSGKGMVLNLLRWGDEIRPWTNLELPPEGIKSAGIRDNEMKMAEQLVKDMSTKWDPEDYKDEFKDAIMKLVHQRVKAGKTETVTPLEPVEDGASGGAQIIDLTELLKRSLKKPGANTGKAAATEEEDDDDSAEEAAPARKKAASGTAAKKTAAKSRTAAPKSAAPRRKAA